MFDGLFLFVRNAWNSTVNVVSNAINTVSNFLQNLLDRIIKSVLDWLDSVLDRVILILKSIKKAIYLVTNGKRSSFVTAEAFTQAQNTAQNKKVDTVKNKIGNKAQVTEVTAKEILEEAAKLAFASNDTNLTANEESAYSKVEEELKMYRIDPIEY